MTTKNREKIIIVTFIIMSIFLIGSNLVLGLLTDDLNNYYSFDEDWDSFSYGNYTDVISYNNFSQNSPLSEVNGKIGRSVANYGSTGYYGISYYNQSFTTPFSFNMWGISYANQTNNLYCSLLSTNPYQFCIVLNDASTYGNIYILSGNAGGTGLDICNTNYATGIGVWNMITTIWRSNSQIEVFINGTSIKNCSISKSYGVPIQTTIFGYLTDLPSTATSNAGLDELGVWNKILSYEEINILYNSGNGLAYPFTSCTENWIQNNTECNGYNYTIQYYDANNCSTTVNLSVLNGSIIDCFCYPNWILSDTPCINNVNLIEYDDANNCNSALNIPANNNTYDGCVIHTQVTWSDDIIILVLLFLFLIISTVCAITIHEGFFGLNALIIGLMLSIFIMYDYPKILLIFTPIIILAFVIMWITINRIKR